MGEKCAVMAESDDEPELVGVEVSVALVEVVVEFCPPVPCEWDCAWFVFGLSFPCVGHGGGAKFCGGGFDGWVIVCGFF